MEKKKHRCKLCFRDFANGRALGGHMRSHIYAQEKASNCFQSLNLSYSNSSSSLPSSSSEEDYDHEEETEVRAATSSYELRRKSAGVLVDHELWSSSETEWSKKSICRRSKRVRRSDLDMLQLKKPELADEEGKGIVIFEQSSPLSSISDTTPEEHVAHSLIMLSRDRWEKDEREYLQEEDGEDSGVAKTMRKYKCEACKKVFRSYQALGGHRASHSKVKAAPPEKNGCSKAKNKIHKCPFCDRIFPSGQALGGHKRSHFAAISSHCSWRGLKNIDLNLPAPVDDDENSQVAISTVSDAPPH